MPSPLYQQFQSNNNLVSLLQKLKSNPFDLLSQRYRLPQNMTDPNEILQYLLNTKQVSQQQVDRVMQMKNDPQIQNLFKN